MDYFSSLLLFLSTNIVAVFYPPSFHDYQKGKTREMKFVSTSFWHEFLEVVPDLTIQNCIHMLLIVKQQRSPSALLCNNCIVFLLGSVMEINSDKHI